MALTRRDVRISLAHDGRPVLSLPASATLRERVAALYGGPFAERLLDVDDVSGTTHVAGLVERPSDVGTATRRVFLSVNGRAVRDTGLVRAAETAYRSTIPAGVRPTLFLDVVVAADSVDVNVHPAKAEVRFRDRWSVERAVETAVRRALGTFDASATFGRRVWPTHAPLDRGRRRETSQLNSIPASAPPAPMVCSRSRPVHRPSGPAVNRTVHLSSRPPSTFRRSSSSIARTSRSSTSTASCSSTSTRRTNACCTSSSWARSSAASSRRSVCSFR